MKILYCAIDQRVPGTTGGAIHVHSVASGLAALGHDVHVATTRGAGAWPDSRVTWHAIAAPEPRLRLLQTSRVRALARAIAPDVVIERYHNFGGEGVLAARACRVPVVLEVNAPVVDYPGSGKQRLDRALIVEPLRRWREWLCRQAALFVTPTRAILPSWVPEDRVLEVEWGADVDRFTPRLPSALGNRQVAAGTATLPFGTAAPDEIVAIFAGAFRPWHGAHLLAEALALVERRHPGRFHGVFVGDGPERGRVEAAAAGLRRVTFTGSLPHDMMPAALAAADIGIAPFDVAAHPPLQLAFYWSPLKVFEYMASGLPVVAPRVPRLTQLIDSGREGLLYDPPTSDQLAECLLALADDGLRTSLGRAARARAVADFSWAAHCRRLEQALDRIVGRRQPAGATP